MSQKPAVSALFVRHDSIYKQLGIDCWDAERDARNFNQDNPVITHPPCRSWGKLRAFAKPVEGEKELAFLALRLVRLNGGILEHPRGSQLFPKYLPLPGEYDDFGGFTILINQHWYGHKAEKQTYLYICGCPFRQLPPIPLSFDAIECVIGSSTGKNRTGKTELSKADRERTPLNLALWLIHTARLCQHYINRTGSNEQLPNKK
jgi:hypothetical protein